MQPFIKYSGFLLLLALSLNACQQKSEYHQMVERELASGERYDSLFLGIHFGMESKDFYTHCWKLNKEGVIREGATNTSVYHELTGLKHPANMEFYPGFYNGKIIEMPILSVSYNSTSIIMRSKTVNRLFSKREVSLIYSESLWLKTVAGVGST